MIEKNMCVDKEEMLLSFLVRHGYAKNKAKSLLKYDNILVDGKVIRQGNFILKNGNTVEVTNTRKVRAPFPILYEDSEFLAIHKKEKLLTVSPSSFENSAYKLAKSYLKAKNSREELYVLHRLDKDTSGILVFCKDRQLTFDMQKDWQFCAKKRIYTAVVEGTMERDQGTLEFYLQERGEKEVVVVDNPKFGKKAITKYRVLRKNKNYSLVELELLTGRKNQIRASFAHIHHSVVGDKKYYSKENPLKRMALVANKLILIHPHTKKEYCFEIDIPKSFFKVVS